LKVQLAFEDVKTMNKHFKSTVLFFSRIGFRMLIVLFFTAAASTIFSCARNKTEFPEPDLLLSEEQMIDVIQDVHLAEATLNFKRNIGQVFDRNKTIYFDRIFVEHGLTPEIFEKNLLYYNQKPEVMEKIYEEVIARLLVQQGEITVEN
jgi:hypothetical protein